MKRIKIFITLMYLIFFFFIVGCKKNSSVINEETIPYIPLDFSKANIGQLHNQYVTAAFDRIKITLDSRQNQRTATNENYRELIIDEFSNFEYDPTPIGYTHPEFINRAVQLTDSLSAFQYDARNWNFAYVPQNASIYIGRILDEIEIASSLNDIYQRLNQIENDATTNLTAVDYDIVKGTVEIARSSAYLWAPVNEGGYDLLNKTFGTSHIGSRGSANSRAKSSWWKKALVGDVTASSSYFLGIGIGGSISAAFIPGTNAVLLGGWAITAGLGSAYGALGL